MNIPWKKIVAIGLTVVIALVLILVVLFQFRGKSDEEKSDSTRQEQVSRPPKYRTRPIEVDPPNELISYPVTVTYEDSKQISFKIDTSVTNRNQFGWWSNKPTTCSYTLSKETGRGRWHQSYPVAQGELVVLDQTIKDGLWSEIQIGQTLNGKVLSRFALEKF